MDLTPWGETVPGPWDKEGRLARRPDLWEQRGKGTLSEAEAIGGPLMFPATKTTLPIES